MTPALNGEEEPPWPDDDEGTRGNDPEGPTTVPPSTLSGPYWDDRPMSPAPALNGEGEIRLRVIERLGRYWEDDVPGWAVDEILEALAARRPATEALREHRPGVARRGSLYVECACGWSGTLYPEHLRAALDGKS